jgi:hypothetical protein
MALANLYHKIDEFTPYAGQLYPASSGNAHPVGQPMMCSCTLDTMKLHRESIDHLVCITKELSA